MGNLLMMVVILFMSSCYIFTSASAATFNVTSYGAIGDGYTDDTGAFLNAWDDLCRDTSSNPTLIIPSGMTFLVKCVSFNGPCNHPSIHIKLLGNITAPKSLDGWQGCDTGGYLISFESVYGLNIDGPGQIDGQGSIWWGQGRQHLTGQTPSHPSMLHFHNCDGLQLRGTKHINSPKRHVSINGCQGVDVENLYISAPEYSPNTDGIDISLSTHVNIYNSTIQSGDDCVAIGRGSSYINVTRVLCGPGHGISIGSLGRNGKYSTVEHVLVQHCNISGTKNGVRIKTVPNAAGYARSITFKDIYLNNVRNPIIIDQHYCNNMKSNDCPSPPNVSAIQVSNVTYQNIHGSSASKQAITLNCSGKFNCTGIVTKEVGLVGDNLFAYCNNVEGNFMNTTPSITCN